MRPREFSLGQRDRRVVTSTIAAVAARLVVVGLGIVAVPIGLGYLGPDRYGIWVALMAMAGLLVFGDFGLGNGLVNMIGRANGLDDRLGAARAVSAAVFSVATITAILAATALALTIAVPWASFLNARSDLATAEAPAAAAAFLGVFVVGLPFTLVDKIRLGYQEAARTALWTAIGAVAGFVGLLSGVAAGVGLPGLILLTSGPPVAAMVAHAALLFGRDRPWIRPRFQLLDRKVIGQLSRLGLLFFVLQLAIAVAYQSDVVVAANVIGPDAAATYSIVINIFMLAPSLLGMGLTMLWPAYTEAIARNDIPWVRTTLRRTTLGSLVVASAATVLLMSLLEPMLQLLTNGIVKPPAGLIVGMGCWAVLRSSVNAAAILMNAANIIRFQVVIAAVMAIASLLLSYVLGRLVGIEGIVWGTVIAYALFAAIPTVLYIPRLLSALDRPRTVSST